MEPIAMSKKKSTTPATESLTIRPVLGLLEDLRLCLIGRLAWEI